MAVVWTKTGIFHPEVFKSEADLEASILEIRRELFGSGRIYLDVKKKIGSKGGLRNIPDGYVLDLTSAKPRLFVVENELAAHDPLRHIAVQILQFSLSFEAQPIAVKKILLESINQSGEIRQTCETYAINNAYRNLDHMLEWLVFESPFAALVIIDSVPENERTRKKISVRRGGSTGNIAISERTRRSVLSDFDCQHLHPASSFTPYILAVYALANPGQCRSTSDGPGFDLSRFCFASQPSHSSQDSLRKLLSPANKSQTHSASSGFSTTNSACSSIGSVSLSRR